MSSSDSERSGLSELLFPELQRQLTEDPSLWPPLKGLFIITVKRNKAKIGVWYMLFQGKEVSPIITQDGDSLPNTKIKTVRIEADEADFVGFVLGGLTGIKAYMSGKIKVKGDLLLAQKLEQVFHSSGGMERTMEFVRRTPELAKAIPKKAKL